MPLISVQGVLAELTPLAQDYPHAEGCCNWPLPDDAKRMIRTKSGRCGHRTPKGHKMADAAEKSE